MIYKFKSIKTVVDGLYRDFDSPEDLDVWDILDWSAEALQLIGASNVFVFSDDIGWCKENLTLPGFNFNFVDLENPYQSMYLMSMCENNIIANSSFSWWGSWLNQKENKRVICPKDWFGPAINKDTRDVYCEGWEVI